ncbi:MAG: OmpA family protein [Pseudomonadota bacterium]
MRTWKMLLCLMGLGLLAACGAKQASLPHDGGDLSAKLRQGYVQKVDTALFILDASTTMFDGYEGTQKFSTAQNLLLRMNSAIAGLKLDTGLHVIGPVMGANEQDSKLVYGMTANNSTEFAKAVMAVKLGGLTPLVKPLTESIETLRNSKGRIAVIIVSDGMNTSAGDPVKAAAELKKVYGDRICIYTVLVGNDPKGKAAMEGIAQAGGCGFATTASTLSSGSELAGFLEKVFLEKGAAPAAIVPAPVAKPAVTERIVLRGINFDFDKAVIKPEFMPVLDVAAGILKKRPNVKVVIEGHTCNIGTDAYNQKLSERRARSVYNYLVQNGVNAAKLSTVGLGETQPMADNKTKSGRQLNRRVEFKVTE